MTTVSSHTPKSTLVLLPVVDTVAKLSMLCLSLLEILSSHKKLPAALKIKCGLFIYQKSLDEVVSIY